MKIYDISQEVFTCQVYPGDPVPVRTVMNSMAQGDLYNLTAFSMCAHNGTHIDAPFHFLQDGKTVEALSLDALVGMAYVAEHRGIVTGEDAEAILQRSQTVHAECAKRILIKGEAEVSQEAAEVFVAAHISLVGNESQTVGPEKAPMAVHKILLEAGVILLEGVRLGGVPEGAYLLSAAPLNLSGADGAPCRAILMDLDD